MNRLLWDICRCDGAGCEKRDTCLRHEQLSNMGPRTPVMSRCFVDEPGGTVTTPSYIPIVESSPAGRTSKGTP